MRLLSVIVLWVLTASLPAGHAAPPKGAFKSQADILRWIAGYKAKPQPDRLPDAVRAMSAVGAFRDLDQAGIYIG